MQKVHIVMRCISEESWKAQSFRNNPEEIMIVYCGYLQFDDGVDVMKEDIWNWCNWSCWCDEERPDVCEHLLIDYCNSDMAYFANGAWYSHGDHKFCDMEECLGAMRSLKQEYFHALWPICPGMIKVVHDETIKLYVND